MRIHYYAYLGTKFVEFGQAVDTSQGSKKLD